jgi:hypothetical protein
MTMGKSERNDIDFVILWVDGADKAWQDEFNRHVGALDGDKRKCRYRDWNNLRFIFRGFEEFTPWVRKIHFVTWGHLPAWLNVEHEKLQIVNHRDFLDGKNLPVFSCNPIEINLHLIPGLADKFVYFNDDTFLLKKMGSERFFKNGLPRDVFAFDAISDSPIAHIKINDVQTIHKNFTKMSVLKRNFFKIFNIRYRFREIVKTLLLLPWPNITGFFDHHQPQPYLKSTYVEVWERESEILSKTAGNKIRNYSDLNQYIFRYWQLCKGEFFPTNNRMYYSNLLTTFEDALKFKQKIVSGKYEMICVNDNISDGKEFLKCRDIINTALEQVLPNKSSFEL